MSAPVRIEPVSWEVVTGFTYTITPEDLEDGKNKLGIDVSYMPLNVPLCHGCDQPVGFHGVCTGCELVHGDIAAEGLTDCHGDPLLGRAA